MSETVWFTADTHFYHHNVLEYCKRPFASVEEMNAALIANWNAKVRTNDRIFILGDFSFCGMGAVTELIKSLTGHKILIRGNHDLSTKKLLRAGMDEVLENEQMWFDGISVMLSHYPYHNPVAPGDFRHMHKRMVDDNKHFLLHGHIHNTGWHINGRMINVGVDVNDFAPVAWGTIKQIIQEANHE